MSCPVEQSIVVKNCFKKITYTYKIHLNYSTAHEKKIKQNVKIKIKHVFTKIVVVKIKNKCNKNKNLRIKHFISLNKIIQFPK